MIRMPQFICRPTEPGHLLPYCVARRNPNGIGYTPLKGEEYATREEAKERARILNKECGDEE